MNRRALLLAVLVYITLDLSLPAMPGAFGFAADDSVEGTQVKRGRLAAAVMVLPTQTGRSPLLSKPRIDLRHRLPPISDVVRLAKFAAGSLPRAVCASSPRSEDPH